MYNTLSIKRAILTAAAANGVGTTLDVRDFKRVALAISSTGSTALTLKIQGAFGTPIAGITAPDFSAAQSGTNMWDYLECIDMEDGAAIDGDTGIVFAGTADFRQVIINTEAVDYLNCIVSGFSAGTVTVNANAYNNA